MLSVISLCFWALAADSSRTLASCATTDSGRAEGPTGPNQSSYRVANSIHISPAAVLQADSRISVNPAFAAFACEERSFLFYAGEGGKPNTFSQNLINEVASRTSGKPVFRVGGTSLDHSSYNPSQDESVVFPPGEAGKNIPNGLKFGPTYFNSFANLANAIFIMDIPMAKANLTNALEFAKAADKIIGSGRIEQLEVGNEPNFYPGTDRSTDYGPSQYVQEWTIWTNAVANALGLSNKTPMFEAVALASPRYPYIGIWNVQNLFRVGLSTITSRIKSYSIHYYQTAASPASNLQRDLMNHTAIIHGTTALASTVQFLKAQTPPIPLNIAEFGSALNFGQNYYSLESTLGAALWQIDFMLWTMSIGVNRVHVQLGIGFGFAPWQPIDYNGTPAKVNPPYYAHIVVADFIGTSKTMQVRNVDLASDTLSAYAGYEDGKFTKLAIVNLESWSSTNPRPRVYVDVSVPSGRTSATIRRLTSTSGSMEMDCKEITWGGLSWSKDSNGLGEQTGATVDQKVVVTGGKLRVVLPASEAVIVYLS